MRSFAWKRAAVAAGRCLSWFGRTAISAATIAAVVALVRVSVAAADPVPPGTDVDVALVFAVDVSYSMDEDEQRLQRTGYADAITAPEVLAAIRQGRRGRIAVAYVEWAGAPEQRLVVDWRLIDGPETARRFADELLAQPLRRVFRTSISGGLLFSAEILDRIPFRAERRVIDVSGDGANNQGVAVTEARDNVLERGIVVNGLPILLKRPNFGYMDITELDAYYEDCVIGGENAFMIPIRTPEGFSTATRMKLLMEVAGVAPPSPIRPAAARPLSDCLIGEKMWRERQEWMRN